MSLVGGLSNLQHPGSNSDVSIEPLMLVKSRIGGGEANKIHTGVASDPKWARTVGITLANTLGRRLNYQNPSKILMMSNITGKIP